MGLPVHLRDRCAFNIPISFAVSMIFTIPLMLALGCQPKPTMPPVPKDTTQATKVETEVETKAPEAASGEAAPSAKMSVENGPTPQADSASREMEQATSDTPSGKPAKDDASVSDKPSLPQLNESSVSGGGPLTQAELDEEYVPDPEILAELEAQRQALRRIADTYGPPPGAKQIGKEADLWIDMKAKRVYVDGYVSMKRGPLEMLACPVGTKEHESVVAVFAKSSEVHAALLAVGAQSGTTARWDPEFLPPTGQTVLVWIAYRDPKVIPGKDGQPNTETFIPDDQFNLVDARQWVRRIETKEELAEPWVFSGSNFWTDSEDGTEYYSANAGDMICVSNFSTAMMDVPFASSADAGNILFEPFEDRIPMRGTPVRLILAPQPVGDDTTEDKKQPDASAPPTETILPMAK